MNFQKYIDANYKFACRGAVEPPAFVKKPTLWKAQEEISTA